jgi:phage/plasmid-like protein (TIGR03299 family)
VWAKEAGMDFEILPAPVKYTTEDKKTFSFEKKNVLYRADTGEALSVVGNRYKVVQPMEVLEFFRDLTEEFDFQLETAGVLYQGQKYWALAKVGSEAKLKGGDQLKQYVMLATSCDGTLRTQAKHVEVRVVCNNTLSMANGEQGGVIKISHSSTFKPEEVKAELGLIDNAWKQHVEEVKSLAARKVTDAEALAYFINIVGDPKKSVEEQTKRLDLGKVISLFKGQGKGSELASAKDTAWGLVNAVTELTDWHQGKDQQRRLEGAWFFQGENLKQKAYAEALKLAA